MRHSYHRGNLGDWIMAGIGIALGVLLFRIFVGLLILGVVAIWSATKTLNPVLRKTVRGVFVGLILLIVLVGLIALF
jgi:hypothetical protein